MEEQFLFYNFATPVSGNLREVIDKYSRKRDKFTSIFRDEQGESGVVYMMLKTGIEVTQYYTVFNYGPPKP